MINKLIGLFVLIAVCNAQKTRLNIYYESLCPDSQKFITQQLYPLMKTPLAERVSINWIPFGKSSYMTQGSETTFTCHHGENECYGNKVQACAIKHIEVDSFQQAHTKESLTLEFINCLMGAGKNFADNIYPGEQCAQKTGVKNWGRIAECANTLDGSNLLKEFGKQTNDLKPALKEVPMVWINEQYEEEVQKSLLVDFRTTLCNKISAPKPQVCTAGNGAEQSIFIAPLLIAAAVIISRIF